MTLYLDMLPNWPLPLLLTFIGLLIVVLGKGADLLVDEAVGLAARWHVPPLLIGATVVSLGTTLPEAAVSVVAAMKGKPEIALGNAVGSVICDTGLILGVATLMSPLPLKRRIVNRQGWVQFAAGCLLIVSCIPFFSLHEMTTMGGMLPRFMGVFFLMLLVMYLWFSIRWTQTEPVAKDRATEAPDETSTGLRCLLKLMLSIGLVVAASHLLIPVVSTTALRLSIPQGIVSATLVAFGTSLPELVTAIT
ncbi:MAG: sodium:calcium antiporter, partial [Desulfosarcina sp.]